MIGRNVAVLGLVALMPFPVRLFSDYHDQPVAIAVYAGTFAAAALLQLSLWHYVTRHEVLLAEPVAADVRGEFANWLLTMPVAFGLLMPVAVLRPQITLLVWLALIPAVLIIRFVAARLRR